jgi:N4-gp56 family major capsid protein
MAVNLASKFAPKVDQTFTLESLTNVGVNRDFEWVGVNAINVLSLTSQALSDYSRTATSNRFGSPAELQDVKQTMTVSKDRGVSIVVDKGNNLQQLNLKTAGRILRLQTSEQVIPEVDQHRLSVMETAAVSNSKSFGTSSAASTSSNAYANVLTLSESLNDDKVPLVNRVLWATPAFINVLKQDSTFILNSDLAYKDLVRGQVGEIDGAKVIMTPSSYFADTDDEAVLAHKSVTVAAEQLNNFKVHMDPPGISGMQIDFRIIYDAFVRTPKVNGIAIYRHNS